MSGYYTHDELRGRGWPKKLIRELLGDADDKREWPWGYLKERVHVVEETGAFRESPRRLALQKLYADEARHAEEDARWQEKR